jgi:hypothetical protein
MVPNSGAIRVTRFLNFKCRLIVVRCPLVYIMSFVCVLISLLLLTTIASHHTNRYTESLTRMWKLAVNVREIITPRNITTVPIIKPVSS